MDFVTFTISDRDIKHKLPKFSEPEDYVEWIEEKQIEEFLKVKKEEAASNKDAGKIAKYEDLISKLVRFKTHASNDKWVVKYNKYDRYNAVTIKPIFIDEFAQSMVFDKAEHVLMMSATIMDVGVVSQSLGIKRDEIYSKRLKSRFPTKNRQIFYTPSGSLSFKNKYNTFPALVDDVDAICKKHGGQKGIIHTHNFEIANLLMNSCWSNGRFLFQKNFNDKTEMLLEHENRKDSIIVAPAMHEGTDLIDDLSRFQIICKVPYPAFHDNEQMKIRMELSRGYYNWLVATSIVQAYGRSVRSEKDWATTYILDRDFQRFYNNTRHILPDWFKEAIIWD
jgi:Rad3-related DNA helicase